MYLQKRFYVLTLVLFYSTAFCLQGQIKNFTLPTLGTPWIAQFTKLQYKAANQNWGIATHPNGFIYVANSDGLLEFDGQAWSLYPFPHKAMMRALAIGEDGKIYTGGQGEFGFWVKDIFGKLQYSSISSTLAPALTYKDEIWKIVIHKNRVLFQSFSQVHIYEHGKVKSLTGAGQPFMFLHQANNRIFIEKIPDGLFELQDDKLVALPGKETLQGKRILSILPKDPHALIIATAKDGLYTYRKKEGIQPWHSPVSELLKSSQINNGIKLLNKYYAFGTILNGIILIDSSGHIIQHINKEKGLQNNTVLSMTTDKQHQIWAGLDNGINRIDITAPLTYYTDIKGLLGTIYSAVIHEDKLYVGTNQGLYVTPWNAGAANNSFTFTLVNNSQGQVWNLSVVDNQLLCGHNDGTFLVEDGQLRNISDLTGGWSLLSLERPEKILLQGNYTGIGIFKRSPQSWQLSHRIAQLNKPITQIEHVRGTTFWISGFDGLHYIRFDTTFQHIVQQRHYAIKDSPGQPAPQQVFKLYETLVFTSSQGLQTYDELNNRFIPYTALNEKLGSFAGVTKILKTTDPRAYWFVLNGKIAYVKLQDEGQLEVDSSSLSVLNHRTIKNYEFIGPLAKDHYFIAIDNGFSIYNKALNNPYPQPTVQPTIQRITNMKELPTDLPTTEQQLSVPYADNNLRLQYALPHHSASPILFQYRLLGQQEKWSTWTETAYQQFSALEGGKYTFEVRAMLPNAHITAATALHFRILYPWYQQWWAYLLYGLLAGAIYLGVRQRYKSKLLKQHLKLKAEFAAKAAQQAAQKAEELEKERFQHKNLELEKALAEKNRQLSNSAMHIVVKNQLLDNVHGELMQLKDKDGTPLPTDQLRKINTIIQQAYDEHQDWELFEKSFDEAHESFFKNMKRQYPTLVPNDLKLCAYLRMNMSSKEIASLLNITTRGVEIRRYRLRKKLQLDSNKNLTEFLMER